MRFQRLQGLQRASELVVRWKVALKFHPGPLVLGALLQLEWYTALPCTTAESNLLVYHSTEQQTIAGCTGQRCWRGFRPSARQASSGWTSWMLAVRHRNGLLLFAVCRLNWLMRGTTQRLTWVASVSHSRKVWLRGSSAKQTRCDSSSRLLQSWRTTSWSFARGCLS